MTPSLKAYYTDNIVTFHIDKGLSEDYFVNRRKKQGERLSDTNKKYKMAIEYLQPEEKTREEYRKRLSESVNISEL